MTSNETRLTVAIADLIISEGLSFNLSQKPRLKKVLDLERTMSKIYQTLNIKIISKDPLDVIHNQNMEAEAVTNHLRTILQLLKKVQMFSWETITHRI